MAERQEEVAELGVVGQELIGAAWVQRSFMPAVPQEKAIVLSRQRKRFPSRPVVRPNILSGVWDMVERGR
jgi:hypothetical protein